ncbi:MAG: TadE family protein [Rhodospirillales bacterium]
MGTRLNLEKGAAAIEFALTTLVFWVPLLLGTLFIGASLVKAIQTVQVARDVGHMYARAVDFSRPESEALVVRLALGMNMRPKGSSPPGDGVVILTTVTYIGDDQCTQMGLAGSDCVNRNHWVMTHRLVLGNAELRGSNYGDPPPGSTEPNGDILQPKYGKDSRFRLRNFNLLPEPPSGGFPAGGSAYMVEAYFRTAAVPGPFEPHGTYACALF